MSATMDRRRVAHAAKVDAAVAAEEARPPKQDTPVSASPATSLEVIDPRNNRCRIVAATRDSLDDIVRRKIAAGWKMVP